MIGVNGGANESDVAKAATAAMETAAAATTSTSSS